MAKIHTHYDNLKVARNAPPEVIRAAYKALSQRFHPDRSPGDPEAARIMAIVNASYDVLSDPNKRRAHDLWIAHQEGEVPPGFAQHAPESHDHVSTGQPLPGRNNQWPLIRIFRYLTFFGIATFFIWIWVSDTDNPPPGPKPYQQEPAPTRPAYVRPTLAPNGSPWPSSAGYVSGYQRLHTDGLSTVTVDNSQNNSDVFVKLVSLDGDAAYPVRQFFIPAFGRFAVTKVAAGTYDIRYRDLSNGGLSRSEEFSLEEISLADGIRFSNLTMTLYKVQNGNMQTYGLSEAEF